MASASLSESDSAAARVSSTCTAAWRRCRLSCCWRCLPARTSSSRPRKPWPLRRTARRVPARPRRCAGLPATCGARPATGAARPRRRRPPAPPRRSRPGAPGHAVRGPAGRVRAAARPPCSASSKRRCTSAGPRVGHRPAAPPTSRARPSRPSGRAAGRGLRPARTGADVRPGPDAGRGLPRGVGAGAFIGGEHLTHLVGARLELGHDGRLALPRRPAIRPRPRAPPRTVAHGRRITLARQAAICADRARADAWSASR